MSDDWLALLGPVGLLLVIGYGVAISRRRRGYEPDLELALNASMLDALRRGHDSVSRDHLALVLLFDANVAAAVRVVGGDPASIRRRLDAHLGSTDEDSPRKQILPFDADVKVLLRKSVRYNAGATPLRVLEEIARGSECLARSLLPEIPPAELLVKRVAVAAPDAVDSDAAAVTAYRDTQGLIGDRRIRVHNDDKTSDEHVYGALVHVFGLTRACARYVTLRVHQRGSATIGPWPKERAEALANQAMADARAKRFPLKVTIEEVR